jgi:hypothetical protein
MEVFLLLFFQKKKRLLQLGRNAVDASIRCHDVWRLLAQELG